MKNNLMLKEFLNTLELKLKSDCDKYFMQDSSIADAAKYSLLDAGKRVRASLVYLTANMCDVSLDKVLPFASAIEMVHCYSLIHDDLPCMDNDDLRRGKPSCHIQFNEDTALLAGDSLIGVSVEVIANDENLTLREKLDGIKLLTKNMGPKGMVYGQELDLKYETQKADKETLNLIHINKTGRLISFTGEVISDIANISNEQKQSIEVYFKNIGLVFQIIDDILDIEGNIEELGKPIGSDIASEKSTFVTLYGLEKSKEIAKEMTDDAIKTIHDSFGEKSDLLVEYTQYLLNRKK